MIIREIRLQNFLSHEDTTVKFEGSINVIIGNNGAGKSSIIDGILFGLFKRTNRDIGKNEELIKKGKKSGQVSIKFEINGDTYLIDRNVGETSRDTISLLKEGKIITLARQSTTVNNKIKEILGFDHKILMSTTIIGQGSVESVFSDFPEVMKELLKINKLEMLRESNGPIHSLIKVLTDRIRSLQSIKDILKREEAEIDRLKKEIEEIKVKLENIEREAKEKEDELNQYNTEFNRIKEIKVQYDILSGELSVVNKKIEEIALRLKDFEEKEKRYNKIETEVKELDENREKINTISSFKSILVQIDSLKSQINVVENDLKRKKEKLKRKKELEEKEKQYEEIEKRLTYVLKNIERQKNEIEKLNYVDTQDLENKIKDVSDRINQIDNELKGLLDRRGDLNGRKEQTLKIYNNLNSIEDDRCPICGRPLDSEHKAKIREEIKVQLLELNKQITALQARINSLIKEREELEATRNKLQLELQKRSKEKGIYEAKLKELQRLEEEKNKLQNEILSLLSYHQEFENIAEKEKELIDYHEEYLKNSDILEEDIQEQEQRLNELNSKLSELEKSYNDYKAKYQFLPADLKSLVSLEERIRRRISELEKLKIEYERLKEEITRMKGLKEEYEKLKEEEDALLNRISELGYSEKRYKQLEEIIDKLSKILSGIEADKGKIKGSLEEKIKNIEEKERNIEELRNKMNEESKLNLGISKLQKLREVLDNKHLQSHIMNIVRNQIENNVNEVIAKFDLSFSAVEIDFVGKSELYVYTASGQKIHINALSGGERISIALALRLAIAKALMNQFSTLILDEPTVNLDEYRRKELIDVIRSAIEIVPQIILVTHDQELIQAGDYIIRVEKKGDTSKVEVSSYDR
ncbi:DNA double-strand break repair ATPase Rad50 [Sulfolobus acidocaldarius]|uniref:DNA double-strand break repair ATPase Rad50 n=1 Tax=Sulfolobus acidocaldarius TaxID=2285 RepID=UPI000782BA05|nr:DNA double-strand break repair ATPase Rad50 [Sulfolobus acidocaldarius]